MPEKEKISETLKRLSRGKRVAVFGTGRSGKAAAELLSRFGIESDFYDEKNFESEKHAEIFDEKKCLKHSLVVYSPAFRPDCKWLKIAENKGLSSICEPDLAAAAWRGKIVAVTGTNGKTTLCRFISKVLNDAGIESFCAGNIGTPLCEFILGESEEKRVAICELSSFQTMRSKLLRPDAIAWTNFAPDHLDWHSDLREYFEAKFRLVENLKSEIFVAGSSVAKAAEEFGIKLPKRAKIFDENSVSKGDFPKPFDTKLQGRNFLAAKYFFEEAGGLFEGAKIGLRELEKSAETFSLSEHRFGAFEEVEGVRFYDDSKATNAHAAIAALEEQEGRNIVWLGGGKDKFCDLETLADTVAKRAKCAVLIGQTAEKMSSELSERGLQAVKAENMKEAVQKCFEMALEVKGDVLFSPGFSSFGMFSNYSERGKSFLNEVLCLKNSYK